MTWLIAALFGICFTGLSFVLLQALYSGAQSYSGTYSEDTARELEDIFLFIPPRRIAEIGWAAAATFFITVFLFAGNFRSFEGVILGLVPALLAGLLGLWIPRRIVTLLKRRRLDRFNGQLVDALIGMSNALKAGFSITQAIEAVVRDGLNPIAQEFDVFIQQTRVGVSFSDALSNMEERVGSDDLTLVVMAIETARKTGGNLTEILEKIAKTIRERIRIELRIRTLTAQGRLQGIIVGAMPVVIGIALMILDPGLMLPFLHSVVGVVTVLAVLALVACGGLIIRKIINIDI